MSLQIVIIRCLDEYFVEICKNEMREHASIKNKPINFKYVST